jgi:transcriptional regulator with XRE-family HTH domain
MPVRFNIRARRKAKGWILEDLARETGLSIQTLSKVENGNDNTTLKSLALIARAFGCGIRDLFEDPNSELNILKNKEE